MVHVWSQRTTLDISFQLLLYRRQGLCSLMLSRQVSQPRSFSLLPISHLPRAAHSRLQPLAVGRGLYVGSGDLNSGNWQYSDVQTLVYISEFAIFLHPHFPQARNVLPLEIDKLIFYSCCLFWLYSHKNVLPTLKFLLVRKIYPTFWLCISD